MPLSHHATHSEKMEIARALLERYRNKEINTKQFMEGLNDLRLNADDVGEIAKAGLDERVAANSGDSRGHQQFPGASVRGRQFASPQDQKDHEASVDWIANYKASRAGAKLDGGDVG